MKKSSVDPVLALEAKMIVALAFRNGRIEDLHAGKPCPTCSADSAYSRISDEEMKALMIEIVNRVFTFLSDPALFMSIAKFSTSASQ